MTLGLLRVRLLLHEAASLKDKRGILKPLVHRLRTTHNVAVAEIGDQDIWRSAVLAITTVAAARTPVENTLAAVADDIASSPQFDLVEEHVELL